MADVNCNTCLYYLDSGGPIGVCRRYPQFQNRSKMEWCGEYVAKKQHIELLELPVVEMGNSLTVTVEPKKRGRKKKEASDVQTSE